MLEPKTACSTRKKLNYNTTAAPSNYFLLEDVFLFFVFVCLFVCLFVCFFFLGGGGGVRFKLLCTTEDAGLSTRHIIHISQLCVNDEDIREKVAFYSYTIDYDIEQTNILSQFRPMVSATFDIVTQN